MGGTAPRGGRAGRSRTRRRGGRRPRSVRRSRRTRREAKEETGLRVTLTEQFHTYSDPKRDARQHTASTVFIATASGFPVAADDAKRAEVFRRDTLPALAFDHARILSDYFQFKETGRRPRPDRD